MTRQQESTWKICERGFAIGKLYFARPTEGEHFYLRLLLTTIDRPRSFEDLRTVNGVVHGIYQLQLLILTLTINIRLQNASPEYMEFSQWLFQVGICSNFDDSSKSMIQLHTCINIVFSI